MEWIQRNPKKAIGLAVLSALVVVILAWGMSGSSDKGSTDPTLGITSDLAMPTQTPSRSLTVLPTPSPSGSPTSVGSVMTAFPSAGMASVPAGMVGSGTQYGLPPHRVVIAAGSDGPLLGVGWKIPTADGARSGKDLSYQQSFRHVTTAYGNPDYAQLYTRVGSNSSTVWCTVTVDGKVVERQEGHGPWAAVYCQG